MDRKIGLFSVRAFSKASAPHGYQFTGLWACCCRYGLFSSISLLVCMGKLGRHLHRTITLESMTGNERYLDELLQFLRIPSVSTDPAHQTDVAQAAAFVRDKLERIGMRNANLIE